MRGRRANDQQRLGKDAEGPHMSNGTKGTYIVRRHLDFPSVNVIEIYFETKPYLIALTCHKY